MKPHTLHVASVCDRPWM